MQRSKAAVSVQVKQVIGALCSLLAASGLDSVPAPESFRRAKFGGGPEVEDQFWQLLADFLQTAGIVSCESCTQLAGDKKQLVAAGLWQTGFYADWMFEREGGRCSSRALLLALGWLLAAGTLEKLVTQRVQKLDKTLCTPSHVCAEFSKDLQIDSASLRKLQWLVGSLRHQGRILLSMQEERIRLLHTLFLSSLSSSPSSSDQVSAVLKEECVRMRLLCDLLESYVNWKQVEKTFWTWMDSVVDCHLTDPVVAEKPKHTARASSGRAIHHGNQGLVKMNDMLLGLPTGQNGHRRSRDDTEDGLEEGEERTLGGSDSPSLPTFPQVYRARFQTAGRVKDDSRPAEGAGVGVEAPDVLPASQAAQMLRQTEALLLERRNRQRLTNRMQLQEMVSRQGELVFIPP